MVSSRSPRPGTPARPSAPCSRRGTVYYRRDTVARRRIICSWGPSYSAEQIKQVLENCKLRFRYLLTAEELIDTAVAQISDNKIVAWMHGRMEFGPRALGNRSILASPHDPYSAENLNTYIKHRECFRKFAASVPAELAAEYFEVGPNARLSGHGGTRARATTGMLRERTAGPRPDPGARRLRGR